MLPCPGAVLPPVCRQLTAAQGQAVGLQRDPALPWGQTQGGWRQNSGLEPASLPQRGKALLAPGSGAGVRAIDLKSSCLAAVPGSGILFPA